MWKISLIILLISIISSCNYRIYYNNEFIRKENIPHLSDYKVDRKVYLIKSVDTILTRAKMNKSVDFYSPLFWSEASFHDPTKLMIKLALRESEKLNSNIIYLGKASVSKFKRYKLSVNMYDLEEPYLSVFQNKIDSSNILTSKSITEKSEEVYQDTIHHLLLNKRNKQGINFAAISGAWIPTGDLKIIGVHPELGFQGGIKNKNFSAQLTLVIKFLDTPNKYLAKDTSLNIYVPTNTFIGPYLGLDLGQNLYTQDRYELQILEGFGLDAFTALENVYKNPNGKSSQDVRSYNINFGLGFKYYFKSQKYFGIETKYNFVDYSYTGITKLKGNFISIRLMCGFIEWP